MSTFLLTGDNFMPEMLLKLPGFTYSACGQFTKTKERTQIFKETGDTSYIYKNELVKECFQHDMANGDFKDLKRKTFPDNVLRDKAFNMMGIKEQVLLWFTNLLIKSPQVVVSI